ncbi:hypothetical protein Moror_15850 [Moniliophthora roreri MCA 2997]|uniref:DUF4939 domain-containing protein n=2 Tax=Moniliophthora roreri TaxID=221103 RepID=V2WMD4_MONRO|nr:hypothetical protein Moror_15850 [Moniliophthora roreri MCA 2997]
MESQLEKDIAEVEEQQRLLQTQSISNPGGRAIPPLTRASHRELVNPLQSLLPMNPSLTETPKEHSKTKKTLTLSFITTRSEEIRFKEEMLPTTPKQQESDTLNTSSILAEESDPFKHLLHALKSSPRLMKQPQIEKMAKEKKLSGSRPKDSPQAEETVIGTTVPVQVVAAEKEVKAVLPRAFTGHRKKAKKFLQEVLLYIALNPKTFTNDRTKKLFLLSYMTDGPGEFWKNKKMDLLLTYDGEAEKVS